MSVLLAIGALAASVCVLEALGVLQIKGPSINLCKVAEFLLNLGLGLDDDGKYFFTFSLISSTSFVSYVLVYVRFCVHAGKIDEEYG